MSFASLAIFTRLVTVADYGLYVLSTAIIGLVGTVAGGWLEQAILRVYPESSAQGRTEAFMRAVIRLMGGPILVCSFLALLTLGVLLRMKWFSDSLARYLLPVALLFVLRPGYGVLRATLQASRRAPLFARYEILTAVGSVLFGVLLITRWGLGMEARLWAEAAILSVLLPFLWREVRRDWNRRQILADNVVRSPDGNLGRRLVRYGVPMAGWLLSFQVMNTIDRFVIKAFMDEQAVGIYGAVYTLVERTTGLLFTPLLLSTYPILVEVWTDKGPLGAAQALGRVVEWFTAIALPLFVLGSVVGRQVLMAVLPGNYEAGQWLLPWLLASFVVWHLAMYVHKGLEFTHETVRMLATIAVCAVANFAGNLVLIPRLGLEGAAAATLASFALYLGLVWPPGRRHVPWGISWSWLMAVSGSTALGAAIAGIALHVLAGTLGWIVAVLAGSSSYLAVLLAVARFSRRNPCSPRWRTLLRTTQPSSPERDGRR